MYCILRGGNFEPRSLNTELSLLIYYILRVESIENSMSVTNKQENVII